MSATQTKTNGDSQAKTEVARSALDQAIEATLARETVAWKIADTGEELKLSISSVRKLFANATRSGQLPSDKECWLFLQLCKARGLNPYVGDAYLVGYDSQGGAKFNLITSHQALLKRAEASGKKSGMESGVLVRNRSTGEVEELHGDYYDDKAHDLVGGWCKVYRKDYDLPVYERLKLATYNKGISRWKDDAAGMIVKCAEASAHRLAFPSETSGMYVREEMPDPSDARPEPAKRVRRSELTPQLSEEPVQHAEDVSQVEPDEPGEAQYASKAHVSPPRHKRESVKEKRERERAPDGAEIPDGALFDSQQDAVESGQ